MDDHPHHYPMPYEADVRSLPPPEYRRLNEADAASDGESLTLDLNTPSTTDDAASVTLLDDEDYKQPLLTNAVPTFQDNCEFPISDPKLQESDPEEHLTFRQKFKRRFWGCKKRYRRFEEGENGCRNRFRDRCRRGGRCRREKRSKVKRAFIFLKLTVFLAVSIYFLSKFFRSSIPRSSPPFEPDSDLDYGYDLSVSSSREIIVEKGRGSIFGRYPLYDLLSLKTTTGSILVHINPQPADPDFPDKPARVLLETTTGSITVSFSPPPAASLPRQEMDLELLNCKPDGDEVSHNSEDSGESIPCSKLFRSSIESSELPIRPYEVEIRTRTGSVHGRLIYSSSASIETDRGSIQIVLVPIVHPDLPSSPTVHTQTTIGSQSIHLSDPIILSSSSSPSLSTIFYDNDEDDDAPTATHSTTTGSLSISYPPSWAGSVNASTAAGSICLEGHGLEVKKDGHGHAFAERSPKKDGDTTDWWGSSGKMRSNLIVEQTGSIQFFAHSETHKWSD